MAKAQPLKWIPEEKSYVPCSIEEVTHLRFSFHNEDGERRLPVQIGGTRKGTGNWSWNGDVDKPTLKPSILTDWGDGDRCHVWINDGVVKHLNDCTFCELPNQSHPLEELD